MSFGDIADRLYFKTIDTAETPSLGTFQLADDMQLNYMRVLLFKKDIAITTERLKINVLSPDGGNPVIVSAWSDLSDIDGIDGDNWIGFLRFDFAGEFLDASSQYVIQLETDGYTRNGDVGYLALSLDWPNAINDNAVAADPAIGVEIYGTC